MAKSPWGQEVLRAAKEAYEFACPHQTPRQLRAFAAGLCVLFGQERNEANRNTADEEGNISHGSTEEEESQ